MLKSVNKLYLYTLKTTLRLIMRKTRSKSLKAASADDEEDAVVAASAIPGVTVPQVRRGLDALRTLWSSNPIFYMSAALSMDAAKTCRKTPKDAAITAKETVESFCIKYVMGHHVKRYEKKSSKAS
jgi:divalent metal cation (Fe/Co/Zn/Cd) transporter